MKKNLLKDKKTTAFLVLLPILLLCFFILPGKAEATAYIYTLPAPSAGTSNFFYHFLASGNNLSLAQWGPLDSYNTYGNRTVPSIVGPGASLAYTGTDFPDGGKYIYALRGWGSEDFYRFNLTAGEWDAPPFSASLWDNQTPGPMGTGSNMAYVGSINSIDVSYIYATAGGNSAGFYYYDTTARAWNIVESVPGNINTGGDLIYPGSGNYIYATAGGNSAGFYEYNLNTGHWSAAPSAPGTIGNGGSLVYPGADVNGGNYIYAIRGGGTTDIYRFNITTNAWNNSFDANFTQNFNIDDDTVYPGYGSYIYAGRHSTTTGTLSYFYRFNFNTGLWDSVSTWAYPFPVDGGNHVNTGRMIAINFSNVYGWAWSENIGWISFNDMGLTTGTTSIPGVPSASPSGLAIPAGINYSDANFGIHYGAEIEKKGYLTGYVWAQNIGWIKLDPAGSYPYSTLTPRNPANHAACVNLPGEEQYCDGAGAADYTLSGWARACSVFANPADCGQTSQVLDPNRGGWDGWINLYNIPTNQLYIDTNLDTNGFHEFHNWLWGGTDEPTYDIPNSTNNAAVIGWGSFNCAEGNTNGSMCNLFPNGTTNPSGTSDYKVVTTINIPSSAQLTVATLYCNNTVDLSWTYTGSQNSFTLQISPDSYDSYVTKNVNRGYSASIGSGGDLAFNTTYSWRIEAAGDSTWYNGPSFKTPAHQLPQPYFSWTPKYPLINKAVTFTDSSSDTPPVASTCYKNTPTANTAYNCNQITTGNCSTYAAANSVAHCYEWWFDYGNKTTYDDYGIGAPSKTETYSAVKNYSTMLQICDDVGCCSTTNTVNVKNPLNVPEWYEVSPFQ